MIFDSFSVRSYTFTMPFAKIAHLRTFAEIQCDCDQNELKQALLDQLPGTFWFIEEIPQPVPIYDPLDYFWTLQILDSNNWMWHLERINAAGAWDYTHGNPQIRIAVIDEPPDIEHPDLITQIYPHHDPLTLNTYNSFNLFKQNLFHGTVVASFAAARTIEQPTNDSLNGQLASIGFNSSMIAYSNSGGLPKVVHASTVLGADVIHISWMNGTSYDPDWDTVYRPAIKEILGNGTCLVAAAGNGFCTTWYTSQLNEEAFWGFCDSIPPDFASFSAPYPFHPRYDPRIIMVTSTDSNDNHTLLGDTVLNRTHSHFPEVDVCSPGWKVMGAGLTYWRDPQTGDTVKNPWPYYGSWEGTSFATPIVSGLCALIKSINPCLSPEQIQDIIKSTTDPVQDGNLYPGKIGTGRINAYEAVKNAQENYGYEEYTIENGQDITWTSDVQAKRISIEWGRQVNHQIHGLHVAWQ